MKGGGLDLKQYNFFLISIFRGRNKKKMLQTAGNAIPMAG